MKIQPYTVIVRMNPCLEPGQTWNFPSLQLLLKSCLQPLNKDMMLQHDTACTTCKVLDRLGINACKEHQKSSAVAVLARVRRGNTLCSICGHSFNSTQSLRTHIQGQHMDTSHLKCKKCDYSAGDSYSLSLIQGSMTLKGRSLSVTLLVVEGSTILKAISMNIRGSTHTQQITTMPTLWQGLLWHVWAKITPS